MLTYRYVKSNTLIKQLVGRILRMPEQKHYKEEELNNAYVYTNLEGIQEAFNSHNKQEKDYYNHTNEEICKLKEEFPEIPFLKEFEIDNSKNFKNILEHFDSYFDNVNLEDKKLKSKIVVGSLENIDSYNNEFLEESVIASSSKAMNEFVSRIENEFAFLDNNLSFLIKKIICKFSRKDPKANIVRIAANYSLIAENLRNLIKNHTDYYVRGDLLKQENFAKDRYKVKKEITVCSENEEKLYFSKYAYEGFNLNNLTGLEKSAANYLNSLSEVKSFIKNGDHGEDYFFIYYFDNLKATIRKFHPDFIVLKNDNSLMLVEAKGAHLISTQENQQKIIFFQKYLEDCKDFNISLHWFAKDLSGYNKLFDCENESDMKELKRISNSK